MREKFEKVLGTLYAAASLFVLVFAVWALFTEQYAESAALFGLHLAGRFQR